MSNLKLSILLTVLFSQSTFAIDQPYVVSEKFVQLKESRIGNGQFWAGTICLGGYMHSFTTKDTYESPVSHEQLFVLDKNNNVIPLKCKNVDL